MAALGAVSCVAGCTSSPSLTSHTTTTLNPPEFQRNATVVIAVPSLPTNFNPSSPAGANEITTEVMEQVWPQAFLTEPQLGTTTEPGFVEDAEVESLSPFTVVYTLNPKAVWSDGTPIGVADFVYNWHEQVLWARHLPDSGLAAGYDDITSITAGSGGSVITVTFSQPFTEWESLFSDLVPAHIGQAYGWAAAFQGFDPSRVVSGGPFEITSFTPGKELVLSRNPRYWLVPAGLAHIVLKMVPPRDELAELRRGLVNIAEVPSSAEVAETTATAAASGLALSSTAEQAPTLWQLCFNMDDATVGSLELRTAIEHSLDLDEITADSAGLADPAYAPYGSRLALGLGLPTGAEPSVPSVAAGATSNGSTTLNAGNGQYDPAAATAAFKQAGYVLGPSGTWESSLSGEPLTVSLLVPTGISVVRSAAVVIESELEAAGLVVHVRAESLPEVLGQALPLGDYQLAIAPFLLTPFPATQLSVYSGSVLPPISPGADVTPGAVERERAQLPAPYGREEGAVEGGVVTADVFGLEDPAVASDLEQAMSNLNPSDDQTLVIAADTRLWLDLPSIPLFQQPMELVFDTKVRGVSDSPTWAGIFWDAERWAVQQYPAVVPATMGS